MPDFTPLGKAVFLSAISVALLLLLLTWPWRRPQAWQVRLAWVLALGAGIYVGKGTSATTIGGQNQPAPANHALTPSGPAN